VANYYKITLFFLKIKGKNFRRRGGIMKILYIIYTEIIKLREVLYIIYIDSAKGRGGLLSGDVYTIILSQNLLFFFSG
jgi:hypothetical protein